MELKQALDDLKQRRVKYYTVLNYNLDNARADEVLFIAGSYLYVLDLTGTAKLKLNEVSGDSIDLFKYRQISSPFYRFFVTHGAQIGKVLSIAVGVGSEFFSLQDFQSPDLSALISYAADLWKTHGYNAGTLIAKSAVADNNTVIVHTVAAGKTFILDQWTHAAYIGGPGPLASLLVRDGSDVTQYVLSSLYTSGFTTGQPFLSIPEGYDICVVSPQAAYKSAGFIKGHEI